MSDENKALAEHGYVIYQTPTSKYMLHKFPTPKNSGVVVLDTSGGMHTHIEFDTYQEAESRALEQAGLRSSTTFFAAEARYDRGLGWETHPLPGVHAVSFSQAKELARKQAVEVFARSELLRDVTVGDVRIRPFALD